MLLFDPPSYMVVDAKHFEKLYEVGKDPLLWEQHSHKDRGELDNFRKFFDDALKNKEGCYTIFDKKLNNIIGSTRFYDEKEQSILIGYTFLSRDYWGTTTNYQVKTLMLNYIFQHLDKVYFRIWGENQRSQKAVEKLGSQLVSEEDGHCMFALEKGIWDKKKSL